MKGRRVLATFLVVFVVGVVGAAIWGIRHTDNPQFCTNCHSVKPYADAADKSFMSGGKMSGGRRVTCTDCHFEPGLIGYARGKVYSLMKLTEYTMGKHDTPSPSMELLTNSRGCLQCHGNDPRSDFKDASNVVDPSSSSYPKIAVMEQYKPETTIMFPHAFHVNTVKVECAACHSAVVHGTELAGEKPQADNKPEFCANCHSGDTAPVIFGEVKRSGRDHPGTPRIDTGLWRNQHWKLSKGAGEIDGVKYDQIDRNTCLACHKEPTEAKACKSCHFREEPLFEASAETQKESSMPLGMFGLVLGVYLVALVPNQRAKRFIFESWLAVILAAAVVATDIYAFINVISHVMEVKSGSREVGPVTLWMAYVITSTALLIFLFHQGVLRPRRRRLNGDE